MFWHAFPKLVKTISTKKFNHQWTVNIFTSPHKESHASRGFPPKSFSEATAVAVQGRLRLEEPLDHGIVALLGCQLQRCFASRAAARGKPRAEPNRNEEKKTLRKFGHLKSRSFGNLWLRTQKSSLGLMNIVVLRMFWWHRVGWKGHVNQVGSQDALRRKLKKCSVSKKTNMCVRLGHNRVWNQSPAV